ncbi:putative Ig domain-containing protein [Pedobacter sp. AW31-3R]|uniref:Ig-like domain-containing protein n=1 Tax=Pedobacter sp. AW31-3R TaxID=3445781 RepID=UPI003FA13471
MICVIAITLLYNVSYAQIKNYAIGTPTTGTVSYSGSGTGTDMANPSNAGSVTAAGNAAVNPPTNSAALKANYFNLLGLIKAEGEAWIQLKYATTVAASKTTYIRFDDPTTSGISLDLLDIVGDLTGLLSKNLVVVDAYTGAVSGGSNGTKISDANVTTTIVKNAAGQNFFAVKSSVPYNSVRVRLRFRGNLLGLALGASINMNVYTPYHMDTDDCGTSIFTNVGDAGLNVSLTDLVLNPQNAIDGNLATFSQLQPGVVSLASATSQTIYFNGQSSTGDVAKIVLSQSGTILNLNVLKTITIQAYNGNTLVGTAQSASNLLNLELLTSLSNNRFAVFYSPPGIFDRIKVTVDNTLNVGGNILAGGLNIHEVQRTVAKPLFAGTVGGTLNLCGGSGLTLSPQNANAGYTYNYYKKVTGAAGQPVLVQGATTSPYTETGLAAGSYTYYITAQKTGCIAESDLDSIIVTVRPVLLLSTSTLVNATVGSVYSQQIIAATGGTPTYTYALAAGSTLPAGLTISAAGLITGTPTVSSATPLTFSITATDAANCKVTTAYTLRVNPKLTLPVTVLPIGTVGTVYPPTNLPQVTGGTTPYTYAATNLPDGLTLNPSTGQITGTPTVKGTTTFPVTVTDADMNTVVTNFTIIVRDPLILASGTLAEGTTNTVYGPQTIPAATGGSGIYTYTAANLPPGLTFNAATQQITGTPTLAGPYTITVNVSDNEGRNASATYTIAIIDPLMLAPKALPDGIVGVTYPPQTIPAATGGTPGYTYTATNLPPGLSFTPGTRVISGTPTQSGTFTVQVKVTDSQNRTITVPYTIRVTGTLNLPAATLPTGTVGTGYPATTLPAVIGGTAPYTYALANLPAGLSFNPATRVITGTPELGGVFTITMSVSDSGGSSTSTDYTLNINVAPPVIAGITVCSGSPATLAVSTAITGVSYRFYPATGNTVLATGSSYTVSPTETTTYYVEAFSGTAKSTRVAVTVTVNPLPVLPIVTTTNINISSGQRTTLQATAMGGAIIKWYATATSTSALATGTTYTTDELTANTTYYVGTESAAGCTSASRVPVLVTVVNGTPNPNCNAATSQESGIANSLLCINCNVSNPLFSVDANPANFTQITLSVGVAAAGYQRLIFQREGVATDSIRLDLEIPTGLLDLTVLGGVTVNVMRNNVVVKAYTLSSPLIGLRLLSGNRFEATVSAGGVYDRVEVRFSPLVSALTSLRIYGAEVIFPNPTVAAGNQTICSGTTASLSATPLGGTTLTWYSAATGGNILANGNTYTTPELTATTTYYIEVSKNGCANPTRVPVTVTVTPLITTPVLAAVSPVCSGSTAVLSISTPQTGITYNWYDAAVGGNLVFTGPVYTITGITANATYYVEGVNGTCISPARAVANVTVNPLPLVPQIQASVTTVNQGQSVSLTATSASADVTFRWYNAANATTPVFTGATYITPPLTATTTYYVEAVFNSTGCASASRVQQTITVNGDGTPIPVLCETPLSQTNGATGTVLVLARVVNPGLAIDGDQLTGSTLTIPVGLAASVFQKVNFSGLSNEGDTLRIRISRNAQLLSAAILGSITVTTYKGSTSNSDATVINNPLINLQLLSGGTSAVLTFVPTKQFDGVELRLNSGLLGALTAVNFDYARRIIKAPTVAAASVAACLNATATLTVTNPETGIIYKWYDADNNYLGNDGATFVTPVITADTRFFVEASRGTCGGSRTAVDVTLIPAPQTPDLISATETCAGSNLILEVQNPQSDVTYQWYSGGMLIPGATGPTYSISNITTGAVYAVEAINSCGTKSDQASITVTVGSLAAPVITPASVIITSGGQTVLTATSSTSDLTFEWYLVDPASNPGASALPSTDGILLTPVLTQTTTFYVIAKGNAPGSCTSATASVTVTVNPIPTTPGEVPCENAVSQTVDRGGLLFLLAGVSNPGLAVDNLTSTSSSLFIPLGVGTFVSQKAAFNGPSKLGDKVKVGLSSSAGLLSLAVAPSITVATYNGGVKGAEMVINNPLISLQLLNGGQTATVEFTPTTLFDAVEVRINSGLVSAFTSVNFNYAQRIITAPAVASANVTTCEGTSATLAVVDPATGVTYNWYRDADLVGTGNTYETLANLPGGTYNYAVSALRNGCESPKTPVTVVVTPLAPTPIASTGNPVSTCLNTPVQLRVEEVAGVTYNWYDAATAGNLLAANTSQYTTPANLGIGITTFYVEATNASACVTAGNRTPISIAVNPPAIANDINVTGADLSFCAGAPVSLTATSTTVTNPVFTWYTDAALSNPVFTGATFAITSISATTTYYVTVRGDNKCENNAGTAKAVVLTVNPPALASDFTVTGVTDNLCAGSPVILTASTTTVTNPVFTWYTDATLTTAVFTGPVYSILSVPASINYYVTVEGTNRCPNTPANAKVVVVTVNPTGTSGDFAVNGNGASICAGTTASLVASSTTVTNPIFTWYSDAALTTPVFTGATYSPTLTVTTTYYVTVSGDNVCESLSADAKVVVVTVNPTGTSGDFTVTGNGTPICAGTTASLVASSTTVTNPIFTWYSDAALTTPVFTGATYSPTLTASTTYYVTVSGDNVCESLPADAKVVVVTVNPTGTSGDFAVTGNGTPICAGTTASLVASSTTVTNPIFTWYSDAALTTPVFTGATYSPTPTVTTTYYVTVSGDNVCESLPADAKVVVVTVNPTGTSGDFAVTGNGTPICAGTTASLVASSTTVTNPIFTWYSDAALTIPVFTGATYSPTLTATTTYYVTVSGDNVCESLPADAKVVVVTVKPAAVATDLTLNGNPTSVCAGTAVALTASSTTVTNPVFTWYTDAALTNAVFTGAVYSPSPTVTTTYYVTVSGDNKCENAPGTAKTITVIIKPAAVATDITISGIPANICAGTAFTLTASTTTVNDPVFTWYTDAALTNAVHTGAIFNVLGLNANTIYYVTVEGSNKCENLSGTAFVVTLAVNPTIVFNGGTLTDGVTSGNYSVQINPATGGSPAFTYGVASGSTLPAGLTLSPTGVLSGRPTMPGDYTFSIIAVDSKGCTAVAIFTLNVTTITMTLPPATLPDGMVGSIYAPQTLPAVIGGTSPFTYTATGVPPGLSFNPITRELTGTPTLGGTFTITVTVTDANGLTATQDYTIAIRVPAPQLAGLESCNGSSANLTVTSPVNGVTYNWYANATGGSILHTGTSFLTPVLTATTTYYVEGESGSAKSSRTAVTVTIISVLSSPLVSVETATNSSILFTWTTVRGAAGYEISVDNGSTWATASSGANGNTHLISGLQKDASVTLLVRAIGTIACQTSASGSVTGIATDGKPPVSLEIYIPNTFTPNGDGRNDIFYVYGAAIAKVKMRIYNQWGQFLFESQQVQNGWDGTWRGQMQPNGVYVYYIDLELTDGTKTMRKGTITLLR